MSEIERWMEKLPELKREDFTRNGGRKTPWLQLPKLEIYNARVSFDHVRERHHCMFGPLAIAYGEYIRSKRK